jgi:predicted transcriptional regulator
MTTREALHELIDQLRDDQTELARELIEDLRDAADEGGLALDESALASLDRGLADIRAGRSKSLEEYERERGS